MWRTTLALVLAAVLASCSPRFDWREVRPPPGGFVVAMPGRPQTVEREVGLPGGDEGELRLPMTMTSTGVGATLFAVGVAVLPAGHPLDSRRLLDRVRDGMLRNIGGTVVSTVAIAAPPAGSATPLRAAEQIAARGTIAADSRAGQPSAPRPARLDARFYVFDDRLYSVSALSAEGELTPELLDTFFSSFRIVGRS